MKKIRTFELTLTRTIPAAPGEVYDAWLDPKLPVNPWHGSKKLDWMSYNTRGLESIVTATFRPKGDETQLTIHHANIPDDELGRAHDKGWTQLTALLEKHFEGK